MNSGVLTVSSIGVKQQPSRQHWEREIKRNTEKYQRRRKKKKLETERALCSHFLCSVFCSVQLMTESARDNIDSLVWPRSRDEYKIFEIFYLFRCSRVSALEVKSEAKIWKLAKRFELKIISRFDTPEWRKKLAKTWFFPPIRGRVRAAAVLFLQNSRKS